MRKTNVILPLWEQCRKAIDENNLELADELLMEMIWKLADYTMLGYKDDDMIEGVKLCVLKERAWFSLENNGLLD
jgi:hypothetical protein